MKKILKNFSPILIVAMIFASFNTVSAQSYYYNSKTGYSSTSYKIGNTTYKSSSTGVYSTRTKIGNTTYYNSSTGYSSTSTKVGNTTYRTYNSPRRSGYSTTFRYKY